MKCTNCGFALSPSRELSKCPRCGAPLNTPQGVQPQQQQFEQAGWERGPEGGAGQQNPWGQPISPPPGPFSPLSQQNQGGLPANNMQGPGSGLQQTPFQPRRPYRTAPQQSKGNPRLLLVIAGLFVVLAALRLSVVFTLASASRGCQPSTASNNTNPNSGNRPTATFQATPTPSASTPAASTTPTDTSAYPGQQ